MEASDLIQGIITGKQPNQITNCDEIKIMALTTQAIRAKENLQWNHGGLRQTKGTDPPLKDLSQRLKNCMLNEIFMCEELHRNIHPSWSPFASLKTMISLFK